MAELKLGTVERMAASLAEAGRPDPLLTAIGAEQSFELGEGLEGLDRPAGPVQSAHVELAQAFAQRVRLDGVRQLRSQVPNSDPTAICSEAAAPPGSVVSPPRLPGAPPGFVGRGEELELLVSTVEDEGRGFVVITNTAGVGKSSLALRWTHQATPHFPDGQVYVDLNGYRPDVAPLSPTAVLLSVLESHGHLKADLPRSPEDLTALYRRDTSHRRHLLLLDNAREVLEVRPSSQEEPPVPFW